MYYDQLSDEEKQNSASLTGDTCKITHSEGTDYFARVVLEIPIHGVEEPFTWGMWVSLSKQSFDRYTSSWGDHDQTDSYFGWLSNRLPHYPNTINLKTNARPRNGGLRPLLELLDAEHPLVVDLRQGLTIQQAQQIAESAMHIS